MILALRFMILALVPLHFHAIAAEKGPLELALGEQRLLRVPGLRRFSLGSDVIRILPRRGILPPETLLLKATRPGSGDLVIWKDDESVDHRMVRVHASESDRASATFSPNLTQGLSRLEEVEILRDGGGVTLRGEVGSPEEAARIASLLRTFPELVQDEVTLSPALLRSATERLTQIIETERLSDRLAIDVGGSRIRVTGSLSQVHRAKSIERRLRAAFSLLETEIKAMPDSASTVHFKVYLLEVKRSHLLNWGMSWPEVLENAVRISARNAYGAVQAGMDLGASLRLLEGTGDARILSQPELVVRAPGSAELFAGGELPVEARTKNTSQVNWKSFGLSLKIKVTHSTSDRARLDIQTEISQLDPSIATSEIPGVSANRMSTQVDADYGKPLLLSGLIQEGSRTQARGIPGLSRIPILGALFGSKDFLEQRSELVAILLPSGQPPQARLHRIDPRFPKGRLPIPREWVSEEEIERLRSSAEYPWNALE